MIKDKEILQSFIDGSRDIKQFCASNKISASKLRKIGRKELGDQGWIDAVSSKKKKQSQYSLGRQFEYRTRDLFEKSGYFVFRSAQSRGVADLIAFKRDEVVFIQCKRGGGINKSETDELMRVCSFLNVTAVIASRPDGRKTEMFELVNLDGEIKQIPFALD